MTTETTYTAARANLARLCDEVAAGHEFVVIRRRGAKDVALVSADELRGLVETAHLLRSPKNARRLVAALTRARTRKGRAQSVADLKRDVGFEQGK